METAHTPKSDSTVEVELFTFFYPLTEKIVTPDPTNSRFIKVGSLRVDGEAMRYQNALGEPEIRAEIKRIRFKGLDIDPILAHWKGKGTMDDLQQWVEKHVREVTFAPKATKENVLKAIIDTVYTISGHKELTLQDLLSVRLSEVDDHIMVVAGLQVSHQFELIVLQGDEKGGPLLESDASADKLIPAIYRWLEKRFPQQLKPIK